MPLEEYKKKTLAERKGDSNEPTRATALHVLAKSKKEFYAAREDVCKQILGHLLKNRVENTDEAQYPERKKRMLILDVALIYGNDRFIDCLMECLGDDFPDFLHLQDDTMRNCIHHLFAWPLHRQTLAQAQKKEEENKLYLDQLKKIALRAKPQTLAAADNEGNTPIHYAMHAKQCLDRGKEYVDIVKVLIIRADETMTTNNTLFNKRKESPVMYWRRSVNGIKDEAEKVREVMRKQKAEQENEPQNNPSQPQWEGKHPKSETQELGAKTKLRGEMYNMGNSNDQAQGVWEANIGRSGICH